MSAAANPAKIDAWWFAASDRLPHGDDRLIVIGESHSVQGKIVLCQNALHASRDPFDALQYAPGPMLYRVRCWGDAVEQRDKFGARHREYLAARDATEMLRRYPREQALSVIHLWDAPDIVKEYLETGDESLRAVAEAAAWATARVAEQREARAAVWAARAAARTAAATVGTAAAVWAARAVRAAAGVAEATVGTAATSAAWATARARFGELVGDLFGEDAP